MATQRRGRVSTTARAEHFQTTAMRADASGRIPIDSGRHRLELIRALSEALIAVTNGFALPNPLTKALFVFLRKKDRMRADLAIFNEVVLAAEKGHPAAKVPARALSGKDSAFDVVANQFDLTSDNVQRIYLKVRNAQRADGNPTKKKKR